MRRPTRAVKTVCRALSSIWAALRKSPPVAPLCELLPIDAPPVEPEELPPRQYF